MLTWCKANSVPGSVHMLTPKKIINKTNLTLTKDTGFVMPSSVKSNSYLRGQNCSSRFNFSGGFDTLLDRRGIATGGSTGFGAGLHDRDFTGGDAFSTGGGGSTCTMGGWLLPAVMLISPVRRRCLRLRTRVAPSVISTTNERGESVVFLMIPGFHALLRLSKTRTGSCEWTCGKDLDLLS